MALEKSLKPVHGQKTTGQKIKTVGQGVSAALIVGLGFILGFQILLLLESEPNYIVIAVSIIGIVFNFLVYFLLTGFGELVDNVADIKQLLSNNPFSEVSNNNIEK